MTKKNDLRIGNLIDRGEVVEIKQNAVRVRYRSIDNPNTEKYSLVNYEDVKPIALTEEMLIEFGFVGLCDTYLKNGFKIEKVGDLLMESRYGIVLRYVHQLQNLYYMVSYKELL